MAATLGFETARPSSASTAEGAPNVTWPGEIDGPKALYLASAYHYLAGTFGLNVGFVKLADSEVPSYSETSPPFNENSTGGPSLQSGQTTMTTTRSIHAGHVSIDAVVDSNIVYSKTSGGQALGSQHSTASAHFDVSPCPEVSGVAGGTISVHLRQDTTFPDGSRSSTTSLAEGPFRVINGDDAHRVRTEVDLQVTADSLHTPAPSSGTDPTGWGLTLPLSMTQGAKGKFDAKTGDESQAKGSGPFPTDALASSPAEDLVQVTMLELEKEVEDVWRSGKCIKLKPSEKSREVDPGEKIEVTVESEQRFDQQEVKTPIKATLTGVKSIEPNGKPVEEPAKFDFVAGSKRNDRGEIEFTQTGKRGIGRETVIFRVKPPSLTLTCTADYDLFSSVFPDTSKIHVVLPVNELKLQADGSYLGTGILKLTGRMTLADRYPGIPGDKPIYVDVAYSNPAELIAVPDAKDSTLVRIQITPLAEGAEAAAGTMVFHSGKRRPTIPTIGIDIWGRIMSNRPIQLSRETVVKDSLRSGALVNATTTVLVSYPEEKTP